MQSAGSRPPPLIEFAGFSLIIGHRIRRVGTAGAFAPGECRGEGGFLQAGLPDIGETFVLESANGCDLLVRKEYRDAVASGEFTNPERLAAEAGDGARLLRGRGKPVSVPIPGRPGERMVVRKYLHGGLSGPLFGGVFFGFSRSSAEAAVAEYAFRSGVPTFLPLAAVTRRFLALFYRAWLVSLEIQGGIDLLEYLSSSPDPALKARVLEAAGRTVRKMHDRGIVHADLHVKNLLARGTDGPAPEVFVLDWDKSRIHEAATRRQRLLNLERLDRSAYKLALRGVSVTLRDRLRFLRGYTGGDGMFEPAAFAGRGPARRIHALLWRIGDLFR